MSMVNKCFMYVVFKKKKIVQITIIIDNSDYNIFRSQAMSDSEIFDKLPENLRTENNWTWVRQSLKSKSDNKLKPMLPKRRNHSINLIDSYLYLIGGFEKQRTQKVNVWKIPCDLSDVNTVQTFGNSSCCRFYVYQPYIFFLCVIPPLFCSNFYAISQLFQ